MKKWFILSLAINFLFIATITYFALTWRSHLRPIMANIVNNIYEQKKTMFEAMPVQDSAIVFLGNSITDGVHWGELFDHSEIINRGIGGDVTAGVLRRINEVTRHQPSKLFIAIGTNDIATGLPTEEILSNYKEIIRSVRAASPATQIYVQSVLPVGENVFAGHNNKGILAVNQGLKKMCEALTIPYLDLHPHFADENGNLKTNLSNDNLHLLGNGYLLWKELLEEYVHEAAN